MCSTAVSYTARCYAELNNDIEKMNHRNSLQPVWTRKLTAEEMAQIFGENPDYIKQIGREIDGKEWRHYDEESIAD